MTKGENRQEHVLALPQGKLKLAWELYRPNFGNTITITTGEPPEQTTGSCGPSKEASQAVCSRPESCHAALPPLPMPQGYP